MSDQFALFDNWQEVQKLLKAKWDELVEGDLQALGGNVEQLVAYIQQKTGSTKEQVEVFLAGLADRGRASFADAGERATAAAKQLAEGVSKRPAQGVAVAFGVGLLAGVATVLLLHGRNRKQESAQAGPKGLSRELREALEDLLRGSKT